MTEDIRVLKLILQMMSKQRLFIIGASCTTTQNIMLSVTGYREKQSNVIRMSKEEVEKVIEILEMMDD